MISFVIGCLVEDPFIEYVLPFANIPSSVMNPCLVAICATPFGLPIYPSITFIFVSIIGMMAFIARNF